MKLTFLGTGTSTGVPQLHCSCNTCKSTDPRDKRRRCSALIETDNGKKLLIDCGPDFREQILSHYPTGDIDALLITHHHYDHVGGTDDLRPYCRDKAAFPVYCNVDVESDFHRRMPYSFGKHLYPGVPQFKINILHPGKPACIAGTEVLPLTVLHYKLPILAFRIKNLAYITDAKTIPHETIRELRNIDTLVINALRIEEHISHMSLKQCLDAIRQINPRVAYLTHLSHGMPPAKELEQLLPPGVIAAYDGLKIEIPRIVKLRE